MRKSILVTGGAGYIGSHTVRALVGGGYHPITLDNLSQGHAEAVTGGELVVGSVNDRALLDRLLGEGTVQAVLHFASLCSVGESMENPRLYFEQNVGSALTLLGAMVDHGVLRFVLSSSCAVYGIPRRVPVDETHPCCPISPYGASKYFIEQVLGYYQQSYGLRSICLRYFNAAGASLDGLLGESHQPETHLIPRILSAARGVTGHIEIYGDNHPTADGTCIRDFVHVEDLAQAHLAGCRWLEEGGGHEIVNLGTGRGYSVREVVDAASRVTHRSIPCRIRPARPGDPPELVAGAGRARRLLGWEARHSDLETILTSAWNWEQRRTF